MGLPNFKELDVLEPIYSKELPSELNLQNLAKFLNINQSELEGALKLTKGSISKNPHAAGNANLKQQWQAIFNLVIEIIYQGDSDLSSEEIRTKLQRWLKLPRPEFSDSTPLDLMLQGKTRKVKALLEQLIYRD